MQPTGADAIGAAAPTAAAQWRSRRWAIVGALSATETVSWGVLYYAFAAFLVPMQRDLGFSTAQLTGAFSVALRVSGIAGVGVGRYLDTRSPRLLMTAGSAGGVVLVVAWSQVRGLGAFYALWAVGLVGVSQIPGRLLFAPLAARLSLGAATASVFGLIAAGIGVLVSLDTGPAVVAGLVLLGMGNGMATLSRATSIADLYGSGAYGTIAGVTASMTTAARAVGTFAAALWAAAVGYEAMLWTLVALSAAAALLAYRSSTR